MLLRGSDAGMASHRLRPLYVDSQHKMGLHFPLHPSSDHTVQPTSFRFSHRFCPTTPLPENVVAHTRPLVQGVGSFGSAQNGASQAPPGKGPHDARHVYWNRNLDRQVHIQNREMPQPGLSLAWRHSCLGFEFQKVMWALLAIRLPSSLALIVWLLNWGLFSGLNYVIP